MDEIVKDFLIESNENLDRLDQELVKLESAPSSQELLASIFRTIHTIKGSCGFLGFARLEKVAHAGENLLSLLRDGKLSLDADMTSGLLAMVDAVRHMLGEIQETEHDGNNDYPELLEKLKQLQSGQSGKSHSKPAKSTKSKGEHAAGLTITEAPLGITEVPQESGNVSEPAAAPAAVVSAEAAHEVHAEPAHGRDESAPGKDTKYLPSAGKIGGVLVERGNVKPEQLAQALQVQERGDQRRVGEILVALEFCKQDEVNAAKQQLDSRSREQDLSVETVRVGVSLLDRLMNLVGELVLARNQLLQFSNNTQDAGFHTISQRMNLIASELQEEVMKTRMQPIGNVWNKFPRTVRDLAHGCQKEVRLEMEGQDTELDRTIIEGIKDPLTHLVRNAVDHGIEPPDVRKAKGKESTGILKLRAFHEGGQVNIEITDDGAGLNVERIRKKALERALITPDQAARMPEREVFNLIFLPGFSTAEKITNVSGRGVGMDVVKTNVEKIGGTVDIQSTLGQGTTVRVKIPLTLAIIPALLVTCRGERFAIPQVSLTELVRLDSENAGAAGIEMVHGVPVYRLRGNLLPLIYLSRELRLNDDSETEGNGPTNIVVLQADGRQFGLVVDEINDTEEIVVKPLRQQLKAVKTFAGSTIMGDGKVSLILDVMGLAQRASVITEVRDHAFGEKAAVARDGSSEKRRFLLFAGPGGSRMAMPLDTLARLEELPVGEVERAGTQWVVQYRGKLLPLVNLESALAGGQSWHEQPGSGDESARALQVLVCNHGDNSVGLVVERILDIVEDTAELKYPATRPGVLYSTVIEESVTEMIDIPAVLEAAGFSAEMPSAPLAHAAGAGS